MALSGSRGRGDPRVLCGIYATEFLEALDRPDQGPLEETLIACYSNLLRLMDMYRNEVMFRIVKPHGFVCLEPSGSALDMLTEPDPLKEIEQLFEQAREKVFGTDAHRVDVADDVMSVLESKLDRHEADKGIEEKTRQFFELVLGKLKQAGDDDRFEAVPVNRMR